MTECCGHEQERLAGEVAKIHDAASEAAGNLTQVRELQQEQRRAQEEIRRDLAEEQRQRKEAEGRLGAELEEEARRDLEEQRLRQEALSLLGAQVEDQLAAMAERHQTLGTFLGVVRGNLGAIGP
ncbi:unnamed protein product [Symbiodinium natans]|uniref:Uncharacterized protein n=1 Tax=Symbiodinium natans TaxID=878477 RepID=A0A812MYD1_9DINO|nr:unnamed protein product [Symbiodinium natans]